MTAYVSCVAYYPCEPDLKTRRMPVTEKYYCSICPDLLRKYIIYGFFIYVLCWLCSALNGAGKAGMLQ